MTLYDSFYLYGCFDLRNTLVEILTFEVKTSIL